MDFKKTEVLERGFILLSKFFGGKHGTFRVGVTAISILTLVQMAMENGYHISFGNLDIHPGSEQDDDYDQEEVIDVSVRDISAEPAI